ncbi:MAG: hypothetical protein COV46_01935 [Deltaproteobacteria bacterium CG11_big_fil_rev_8_21_14_0_20_49_13]|nr:MAG: hypothetical protein COV46_01935 [Deltaproteobacteria bacterium CG11_big_fil_rev_8_21_14_0_20_49_13]
MNIGEYLKSERESRGIELQQIADITKISIRHLKAMEEGKLDVLPSRVFVKGFIKAYSKSIGLEPTDVLCKYEESLRGAAPQEREAFKPKIYTPPPMQKAKAKEKEKKPRKTIELPKIHLSGRTAFFIIAATVIVLSIIFSLKQ